MKQYLLSLGLLAAGSLTMGAQEQTSQLVSDNIVVPVGTQNHMFIKAFSEPVMEYLASHPRIAIEFETADATIVQQGGAWFKGLQTGKTKVVMAIYEESPSFKDFPNYDRRLDEVTFEVTVADSVPAQLPKLLDEWGLSRATVDETMKAQGYTDFNATYAAMNPGMTEAELAPFHIFYTDDYEYPVVYNFFNDYDQLVGAYTLVNNATRLGYMGESEITQYLEAQGYAWVGFDEMGWPVLYNAEKQSQASGGIITVQGQYYRMLALEYNDEIPEGIHNASLDMPTAVITKEGGALVIDAKDQAGQTVSVYGADGKLLQQRVLTEGKNRIELETKKPVVVQVGRTMGVKVL